jgi:hypothetical protein
MLLVPLMGLAALIVWLVCRWNVRPQYAPVLATGLIIVVLYIVAGAHVAWIGPPAAVLLPIALLIDFYRTGKWQKAYPRCKQQIAILGAFLSVWTLLFAIPLHGVDVWHMDEFQIWASRVKHLALYGNYEPRDSYFHSFYPPGASLFKYFISAFGEFREWYMYLANALFALFSICIFMRFDRWRDLLPNSLLVIITSAALYLFTLHFSVLQVDVLITFVFAAAMVLAARVSERDRSGQVTLVMLAVTLVLLKQVGLLFAAIVLGVLAWRLFFRFVYHAWRSRRFDVPWQRLRKRQVHLVWVLIIAAVLSLGTYKSWSKLMPSSGRISVMMGQVPSARHLLASAVSAVRNPKDERERAVPGNYWRALNGKRPFVYLHGGAVPMPGVIKSQMAKWQLSARGVTILLLLMALALVLIRRRVREPFADIVAINALFFLGSIAYIVFFLFIFIAVFPKDLGTQLGSMERYFGSYYAAWLFSNIALLLPSSFRPASRRSSYVRYSFVAMAVVVALVARERYREFWTGNPYKEMREKRTHWALARSLTPNDVPTSASVYVIYTGDVQYARDIDTTSISHYEMLPRTANRSGWWLGRTHLWPARIDKTVKGWEQILRSEGYQYVYLAQTDEEFWSLYGSLFMQPVPKHEQLFRVDLTTTGGVVLKPASYRPTSHIVTNNLVAVQAHDMEGTSSFRIDPDGGVWMMKNGTLKTDYLHIPFTPENVELELKGEPAAGVWPQLELIAEATTDSRFQLVPKMYFTTPTYSMLSVPAEKAIPPGEYRLQLNYLNNSTDIPPGNREDRNLSVRTILLHPAEDKATGASR